ncbi:hypothetical protein PINS_up005627 [Pythium insidiosum]|nr:hypothetical protein PINS_up005627 [Pythium insidiosum]
MLDKKLATRDKWQICTQRNLSEIRSECMKVRRQLATLTEAFDGVQMQVEDGLSGFDGLKADVRTAMKDHRRLVRSLDAQLKRLDETLTSHVESTKEQVEGIEKKLSEMEQNGFTEEDLTAQLATLQEQFEIATTETREEYSRLINAKFQAVESLARRAASVHELLEQRDHHDTKLHQHLKALQEEAQDTVGGVARRVYGLEEHQERQHTEIKQLRSNADTLRRQLDEMQSRMEAMARNQDHLHRAQSELVPMHSIPPPPPPLPPVDIEPLKEAVHFLRRDVSLMAEDLCRFDKRATTQIQQLRHEFNARFQDLSENFFGRLKHDSDEHCLHITRLKDAFFDLQAEMRSLRQESLNTQRMVHDMQGAMPTRGPPPHYRPRSRSRSRSRSPPPYGSIRPPAKRVRRRYQPLPPEQGGPVDRAHTRSEIVEREYTREFSQYNGDRGVESPTRRGQVRDRSRSRSPNPRLPSHVPTTTQMIYQPLNRPDRFSDSFDSIVVNSSNGPRQSSSTPDPGAPSSPPPNPIDSETTSQSVTSSPSIQRRPRRPRKAHEVIVIEEEDDDDSRGERSSTSDSDQRASNTSEAVITSPQQPENLPEPLGQATDPEEPPHMAPPDTVLDDEETSVAMVLDTASNSPTDVIAQPDQPTPLEVSPQPTEAEPKEASTDATTDDLRVGCLLYVCFGGAPSLDVAWAMQFSTLREEDCVTMAEALRFQQHYEGLLLSYPMHLTQFIIQATHVDAPNRASRIVAQRSLTELSREDVHTTFKLVVGTVRRTWIECMTKRVIGDLQQMSIAKESIDANGSSLTLLDFKTTPSIRGLTTPLDLHRQWLQWRRQQADALRSLMKEREGVRLRELDASPGVFLFFRLFDVVEVQRNVPQHGHFRLNAEGRAVVSALWGDLLSKLPYLFFIDCSWLEAQSEQKGFCNVPRLGLCHLLATLLVWHTSAISSKTPDAANVVDEIMVKCIDTLSKQMIVKPQRESEHELLTLDGTTHIELVGVDSSWVALMELDGFFEVADELKCQITSQ